jgi:hypothetical protein
VSLEDSAVVSGDVVSVGGRLDLAETALIEGESQEVGGFGLHVPRMGLRTADRERPFKFLARAVWVFILTGVGIGAFRVFPARMHNMADTVQHRGFVAFLAGFAGWILWLPIFIILCVTLIGIPVALLLIFLTPVMTLLGYLAVAEVSGRRLATTLRQPESLTRHLLLGVLILEGLLLLSKLVGMMGSVFEFFAFILGLIGWSIIFVAATIGFGVFLMTRFKPPRPPRPAPAAESVPPPSVPPPWAPPPSIPPPSG